MKWILVYISDRVILKLAEIAEIADQIYAIPIERGYVVVTSTTRSITNKKLTINNVYVHLYKCVNIYMQYM
jgi:hypothetical protein